MTHSYLLRMWASVSTMLALLFLVSCTVQQDTVTTTTSQDVVSDEVHQTDSLGFVDQIPTRFTDDQDFLTCAMDNIDMCMEEVVMMQEDSSAIDCDDFLSERNRSSCLENRVIAEARDTNDSSVCEQLSDSWAQRCENEVILAQASQSGDTTFCDRLWDSFERVDCNNSIIYSQAFENLDPSICNWIIGMDNEDTILEQEFCRDEIEMMIEFSNEGEL